MKSLVFKIRVGKIVQKDSYAFSISKKVFFSSLKASRALRFVVYPIRHLNLCKHEGETLSFIKAKQNHDR